MITEVDALDAVVSGAKLVGTGYRDKDALVFIDLKTLAHLVAMSALWLEIPR